MTNPPETPPAPDESAAELAALRKEKAEREAAENKAKDDELASLREFKSKAEKAPAPVKTKEEKKAETPPVPPAPETPDKPKKPKHGASRRWFGSGDDDE